MGNRLEGKTGDSSVEERILDLVREHMGIRDRVIEAGTSLQGLGMDGDDAVSFMVEFAREFRVDMKFFNFKRHFGLEGLWLPGLFRRQHAITISDLVEAAKAGCWPARET